MAWESQKQDLLEQLSTQIEEKCGATHRAAISDLAECFFSQFPSEDMHGRSVENLYGFVHGLWRFLFSWNGKKPKVCLLNPAIETDGWEGRFTSVMILSRNIPFLTASLRGELNLRQVRLHTLCSCNINSARKRNGELQELVEVESDNTSSESLVYFEINPHTGQVEIDQLKSALESVLNDVEVVVDDFEPMRERIHDAIAVLQSTEQVDKELRDEAAAFLDWLERFHMTFLGYEYLQVKGTGDKTKVSVKKGSSLGLLRNRSSSGVPDLSRDLQEFDREQQLRKQLSFSKSRIRSRVHRSVYPDYIEIKAYNTEGDVVGQHRFMGLYTASVYTMSPRLIPILRRKVQAVMDMSGLEQRSHASRELLRVLEMFPRDELFQSSIDELYRTCTAVNQIQERRKVRLFVRRDRHDKFFNCLVYIPRDRYNTELRLMIDGILSRALGAQESEFTTHFSESILVRCHFVFRVDPSIPVNFDITELEEQIVQATLSWEDRLRERLAEEFGEEAGDELTNELGQGFPAGYRADFDPRVGVLDVKNLKRVADGEELVTLLHRAFEGEGNELILRLYHADQSLPLSDVLPILENLGLRVVSERPYEIKSGSGRRYWVQEFTIIYSLAQSINVDEVAEEFEDAFARIWFGEAESDSFNRLLLGTRLNWREIALLRAYARYLRQVQFNFSVDYIAETMADHLQITASIVELFLTRFSPVFDGDEEWRQKREGEMEQRVLESLDTVQNLGQDRIIRQYVTVIKATLRTNFFQENDRGELKSYFSFKLSPSLIPEIPQPVPLFEIYVYSPRVEGVHLRGGKVARGGLRWSDRLEDFRTEVLGLVKAQQVKNAVIVPVGAKGGFVAKRLSSEMSRDDIQKEGVTCYQTFIRGLLDITDNRVEDRIEPPPHVVRKDEDDPYLVVAADKGTATFSDIANQLSADYGFWLGDAFASGGSVGYDHKKMGITARGAWVSVQRHFREMGVDVQNAEFTAIGVGDMAGDVFGNGMLMSRYTQLVAAFNHLHIFIDPNPDPAASYEERQRLFELSRSSWEDYNVELISAGGGVFSRSAKSINVTPEMQKRFDIDVEQITPNDLISALLRAPVDLLWNGGIGTYVKASTESHTDVGDKANDSLRVDGRELRCKVVGEGGNLGMTQLGRVEFGLNGGRSNTDFIDNAGGVDCSDHEVNIKILLNAVVERGDLTVKHRNTLLEEMTDSVSELVLKNNYRQVQAISLIERQAEARSGEYRRFIASLEGRGRLDRALEFLPSDEELGERRVQGKNLTRPEIAVLVSYSKAILKEELITSHDMGNDPYLTRVVTTAFPPRLLEIYSEEISQHQLHDEILATQLANDVVNRMGLNFMMRLQKATGASFASIAKAYTVVNEIYEVSSVWDAIEALDFKVSADIQLEMMTALTRLIRRATRWVLRNRRHHMTPTACIEELKPGVQQVVDALPTIVVGEDAAHFEETRAHYTDAGVPEDLASLIATGSRAYTALGIIEAGRQCDVDILRVAQLYYSVGHRLELDWFANLINSARIDNEWQALARDTYLEDLEWQQRSLAIGALAHLCEKLDVDACMERWVVHQDTLVTRWQEMLAELHATEAPDFAMFAVANRELLDLAQASTHDWEGAG